MPRPDPDPPPLHGSTDRCGWVLDTRRTGITMMAKIEPGTDRGYRFYDHDMIEHKEPADT